MYVWFTSTDILPQDPACTFQFSAYTGNGWGLWKTLAERNACLSVPLPSIQVRCGTIDKNWIRHAGMKVSSQQKLKLSSAWKSRSRGTQFVMEVLCQQKLNSTDVVVMGRPHKIWIRHGSLGSTGQIIFAFVMKVLSWNWERLAGTASPISSVFISQALSHLLTLPVRSSIWQFAVVRGQTGMCLKRQSRHVSLNSFLQGIIA